MVIRINDNDLGECKVTSIDPIKKDTEMALKFLCMLQLLTLNKDEDPDKYKELIEVLREAKDKINRIYNYRMDDATEYFD